jgi:N-acetylmuramoyl-L-alanine amidase
MRYCSIALLAALSLFLDGCGTTSHRQQPDDEVTELPPHPATISEEHKQPSTLVELPVQAPAVVPHDAPPANPQPASNPEEARWQIIPPAVADRYPLAQPWIPLREWCLANQFSEPKRIASSEGAAYSFNVPEGSVVIQTGNRTVTWCGVSLYLGFPPTIVNGAPSLAALDIRKNFEPLLGMAYTHKHGRVIVIDPGHGGTDTGTRNVSNNHPEKEFTLDWALRLRPLLAAQGWTVYLTRSDDEMVKLPDRVTFADKVKADIFLSLHFNSAYPETHEVGLETYCVPSRGMPSNLTRGSPDIVSIPLPNNLFDAENIRLAEHLHRSLLAVNGHQDRGVRRARFLGVLKWQQRPSVLIEGGYLSNPEESRRIADPKYRQHLAEAVASALKNELSESPKQIAATNTALPKNLPADESFNTASGVVTSSAAAIHARTPQTAPPKKKGK